MLFCNGFSLVIYLVRMKVVLKICLFFIGLIAHHILKIFEIYGFVSTSLINLVIISAFMTFLETDGIKRNASLFFTLVATVWFSSLITSCFDNHYFEVGIFQILIIFPEVVINLSILERFRNYLAGRRIRGFVPSLFVSVQLIYNIIYISLIYNFLYISNELELKLSEPIFILLIPVIYMILIISEIYILYKIYMRWSEDNI